MALQAEVIARTLGGPKVLGTAVHSLEDLRLLLHDGLPVESLLHFAKTLQLNLRDMCDPLQMPERTLFRRKQGAARLSAAESDRLFRVARIFAHAIEVFGEAGTASDWLTSPLPSLNQQTPLSLLNTDAGALEVDDLLGQIEHGIIS